MKFFNVRNFKQLYDVEKEIIKEANRKLRESRANRWEREPMFTEAQLAAIERGEPVEIPRAEEEHAYLTRLSRKRRREECTMPKVQEAGTTVIIGRVVTTF
jgi:hypothetical protein